MLTLDGTRMYNNLPDFNSGDPNHLVTYNWWPKHFFWVTVKGHGVHLTWACRAASFDETGLRWLFRHYPGGAWRLGPLVWWRVPSRGGRRA